MGKLHDRIDALSRQIDRKGDGLYMVALREGEPGHHMERVGEFAFALARFAGQDEAMAAKIRDAAQTHDIGKMSVDAATLRKAGALTPEEFEEIQRHTIYGERIVQRNGGSTLAAQVARSHHEKWDGSGYPDNLAGEAIPFAARVVAIVDVYDALRGWRAYKPAFGHAEAVEILLGGDGRIDPAGHFDPSLLRLFGENHQVFDDVWARWAQRRAEGGAAA